MKRKLLIGVAVLVVLGAAVFFFTVVPAVVERHLNRVLGRPPYEAGERARALHATLFVADLHADTLLWDRDVLERSARGHADLPRLLEGGVSLQAFTVVTKVPFGSNYESTSNEAADEVTPLAVASRWPARAWRSLKERALHQARKLREAEARSGGRLVIVRTAGDLARFSETKARGDAGGRVACLLGVEGAHALEGDLGNVDAFFDAGFRMMAPTHFFDNEWGGSAHGLAKTGLTEKGRELVRRMEARGMVVDLAHASEQTVEDVLALATRPPLVSHTGLRGACPGPRNLSDEHLRRIAGRGGVVGVGFWPAAVCGTDARAVARSIRYAADLVGVEHVALGSDFDGAVTQPFDATGLVQITDALLAEGFREDEIRKVMGGNVLRVLSATLPR